MEQDDYISSSVADTIDEIGDIEPTALQRLQRYNALRNAPRQVRAITSSELEFRSSINEAETDFVVQLEKTWLRHARHQIGGWQMRTQTVDASLDAYANGVDHRRQHWLDTRAHVFVRESITVENRVARRTFHHELGALAMTFKRHKPLHRYYVMGSNEKYRKHFRCACHSAYLRALDGTVNRQQARSITYRVAKKSGFHSGAQLWRFVEVDEVEEMLSGIHFD